MQGALCQYPGSRYPFNQKKKKKKKKKFLVEDFFRKKNEGPHGISLNPTPNDNFSFLFASLNFATALNPGFTDTSHI
jgi:hypothetical protein